MQSKTTVTKPSSTKLQAVKELKKTNNPRMKNQRIMQKEKKKQNKPHTSRNLDMAKELRHLYRRHGKSSTDLRPCHEIT